MLGNAEVADLIAPRVTQLTTLLLEPACGLIKPTEIDYNFIEVEHQYLFDIAGKRFIKESGSLMGSPRAFTRYDNNESKKTNPAPFIEGTHFNFAIFLDCNQLISKLYEGPENFVHSLSHIITPYSLGWKENHFHLATLKLVPTLQIFYHILSCLITLSLLITPYPLGWKENHFHLATLKLVPRLQILYHHLSHLVTPCHMLSQLIP